MDNTAAENWQNAGRVALSSLTGASLWPRFCALIIDGIIVSLLIIVLIPIFGVDPSPSAMSSTLAPANTMIEFGNFGISWAPLVYIVYYFPQEWLWGSTIGKWWTGVAVVDLNGRRLSLWSSLLRNIIRLIDYSFFAIGCFLVLLGSTHQRLGDNAANSVVVGRDTLVAPLVSRQQTRRNVRWLAVSIVLFTLFCLFFAYYLRPPLVIQGMYNRHLGGFYDQVPAGHYSSPTPPSCITGYTLGAPSWDGDTVTYSVTYQIYNGAFPNQQGIIILRWAGASIGFIHIGYFDGWEPSFSIGPSACPA